jgi:NAD(P)-dependent dehydrogenase (short-subunit alcohol dehydrogenase family)
VKPLDGKVVLISGTAGGMGRAAAVEFAAVVGCDIDDESAAQTVELVSSTGGRMTSLAPIDLTSEEDAAAWVAHGVATYDGVDVLYNNASIARVGPFDELTLEGWRFAMTYELDLVFISTKAAWPALIERGVGVVIMSRPLPRSSGLASFTSTPTGRPRAGSWRSRSTLWCPELRIGSAPCRSAPG